MNCPMPREEMLKQVQQLDFMVQELQLYLDTHPDDCEAFALLKQNLTLANKARQCYEKQYGALTLRDMEERCAYDWAAHPWPWELEG